METIKRHQIWFIFLRTYQDCVFQIPFGLRFSRDWSLPLRWTAKLCVLLPGSSQKSSSWWAPLLFLNSFYGWARWCNTPATKHGCATCHKWSGLQAHVVVCTYSSSTWMLRQVDCEISLGKTSLNFILRLYLKQEEEEGKEEKEAETAKEPIRKPRFQNISLENHPSLSYSQKLQI